MLMAVRWGCYVNRIDVVIVDQGIGIGIIFFDPMPVSVILEFNLISSHHRGQLKSFCFLVGRPAFDLCYISTTDHSPSNGH